MKKTEIVKVVSQLLYLFKKVGYPELETAAAMLMDLQEENKRLTTALDGLNKINDKLEAKNKELAVDHVVFNALSGCTNTPKKPEHIPKFEDIIGAVNYHVLHASVSKLKKDLKNHFTGLGHKNANEHYLVKALDVCLNGTEPYGVKRSHDYPFTYLPITRIS